MVKISGSSRPRSDQIWQRGLLLLFGSAAEPCPAGPLGVKVAVNTHPDEGIDACQVPAWGHMGHTAILPLPRNPFSITCSNFQDHFAMLLLLLLRAATQDNYKAMGAAIGEATDKGKMLTDLNIGPSCRTPIRASWSVQRALLHAHRPHPGHSITAVKALKSSLLVTARGKGPAIRPDKGIVRPWSVQRELFKMPLVKYR